MMVKKLVSLTMCCGTLCFFAITMAGCNEKAAQPEKPTKPATAADLKALPPVVLTATKIQENADKPTTVVHIAASGAFGSNVVEKTDPDRIIAILHNTSVGEAPKSIAVNNGTINKVDIDQLDTGKGSAVRITIGLDRKTAYKVTPAAAALLIDVEKKGK